MPKIIPSAAALAAASLALAWAAPAAAQDDGDAEAVFAGGCFWCVEADFEKVDGVSQAVSGYTGGHVDNPTYDQVTHEDTGHYEAARIVYDPDEVSYETLLEHYWRNIDPFDAAGQFCDKGPSYRTAIFVTPDQRAAAEASLEEVQARFPDREIATEILPLDDFWTAESYHQDYYKKSAARYDFYREGCGRDRRLQQIWGDEALGLNAKN